LREEIKEDLRNRRVVTEDGSQEGEGAQFSTAHLNEKELQGLKKDLDMYPQGGEKAVFLRDKF